LLVIGFVAFAKLKLCLDKKRVLDRSIPTDILKVCCPWLTLIFRSPIDSPKISNPLLQTVSQKIWLHKLDLCLSHQRLPVDTHFCSTLQTTTYSPLAESSAITMFSTHPTTQRLVRRYQHASVTTNETTTLTHQKEITIPFFPGTAAGLSPTYSSQTQGMSSL